MSSRAAIGWFGVFTHTADPAHRACVMVPSIGSDSQKASAVFGASSSRV